MWLLNARTRKLESFVDERAVSYAILSHTWGEEELSFQAIQQTGCGSKKGYEKIAYTCRQALEDGYDYAWIDTVCINKESSAELSEAINSSESRLHTVRAVFRWYSAAGVCYAYLSDVRLAGPSESDHALSNARASAESAYIHSKIYVSFDESRWFTRGWTLQELIAPRTLLFFDNGWTPIGSKEALTEDLGRITKIDRDVLAGRSFLLVSVATRMSWAALRKTSRVEDRAYSLLGIFDVNMPLIYGEGTQAFRRLQEEIMKKSTDQSIFCWNMGPSVDHEPDDMIGTLLAPSPDEFAVRGSLQRRIRLWEDSPLMGEHYRSNRGLEICLPVIKAPESDVPFDQSRWGILSCKYENDFIGPIALVLRPDSRLGDTQGTEIFTVPNSRHRTVCVPLEQALKATFMQCTIRWDAPRSTKYVPLSSATTEKFWLRTMFPSGRNFVPFWTGPPLAWVTNDVLAPRELGTHDAYVIWYNDKKPKYGKCHIGLAVRSRRSRAGCGRSPKLAVFLPKLDDGIISDEGDKHLLAASQALDLAGGRTVSAFLYDHLDLQVSSKWQVIMGEAVVVIDVRCTTVADHSQR